MGMFGIFRSLPYGDPILLLLMGMRSLESIVIPELLADRVASQLHMANYSHLERLPCQGNSTASEAMVQSEASRWAMGYWLASSLPGAFTAILIGGWSDRVGRRLPILLALTGYAVEAATAMMTQYFSLPLEVLIAGSAVEGICGSYPTVLLAVYAHTADFSTPQQRTPRLLVLALLEYGGVAVCALVSGIMLKKYGVFWTECLVLGGHIVSILYTLLLLEDSRGSTSAKPEHNVAAVSRHRQPHVQAKYPETGLVAVTSRTAPDEKASYWYSVKKTFRLLLRPWERRRELIVLLFCFQLIVMNFLGISDVQALYTMHRPLCWPSTTMGYFNASRYACLIFSVGVMSRVIRRYQPPDRIVVQVSILGIIGYFATIACAWKTYTMFIAIAVVVLAGPCIGTMRSMISKLVPDEDHGAAFATIASLETLITVMATVIYNNLYSYLVTLDNITFLPHPGSICFIVAAALNFLPIVLLFAIPVSPIPTGYARIED